MFPSGRARALGGMPASMHGRVNDWAIYLYGIYPGGWGPRYHFRMEATSIRSAFLMRRFTVFDETPSWSAMCCRDTLRGS